MAHVKDNIVTEGFSGKLGNRIVFRQLGNRTIVAKRPLVSGVVSEDQVLHRKRFRSAAAYAKAKMLDPASKAEYVLLAKQYALTSPFVAAVADYLTLPEIDTINTDHYSGAIGDVIMISSPTGPPKIASVQVSIIQPDDTVVETGQAIFSAADAAWKYVATVASAVVPGSKVKAVATDKPGNVVTKEKVL